MQRCMKAEHLLDFDKAGLCICKVFVSLSLSFSLCLSGFCPHHSSVALLVRFHARGLAYHLISSKQ